MKKVIHLYSLRNVKVIFCGITAPATLEISSDQLDSNGVLKLSPGEKYYLSIIGKDDLNNSFSGYHSLSIPTRNSSH